MAQHDEAPTQPIKNILPDAPKLVVGDAAATSTRRQTQDVKSAAPAAPAVTSHVSLVLTFVARLIQLR
jgi:hypothetical protein